MLLQIENIFLISTIIFTLILSSCIKLDTYSYWDHDKFQLHQFKLGLDYYFRNNKKYPTTKEGLECLDDLPVLKRKLPKVNPWGHKYIYKSDGYSYVIISIGQKLDDETDNSYIIHIDDNEISYFYKTQ